MQYKLEFTLEAAIKEGACQEGIDKFKNYLKKKEIRYNKRTKFPLALLVKSNGITDALWALRCTLTSSKEVAIIILKKVGDRAAKYAADAAKYATVATAAAYAANYAVDAAADAAYVAQNAAADAAYAAANAAYVVDAAKYAADTTKYAAYAANYAADAATYAGRAANYTDEREEQKQDLLKLLYK